MCLLPEDFTAWLIARAQGLRPFPIPAIQFLDQESKMMWTFLDSEIEKGTTSMMLLSSCELPHSMGPVCNQDNTIMWVKGEYQDAH